MDIANDFFNNYGTDTGVFLINMLGLLKLPIIILLMGNLIFSLLLLLRVRILADTFSTPENRIVKTIMTVYVFLTLIGSLLSLLFLIIS